MWRTRRRQLATAPRLLVLAVLLSGDCSHQNDDDEWRGRRGSRLLRWSSSSSSSASHSCMMAVAQNNDGGDGDAMDTAPVGSGAAEWRVSTAAGDHAGGYKDGNASTSLFSRPQGIAFDASRNLVYLSDAWNHRIRVFDVAAGTVSTLAGTGAAGHADGSGRTAARFNFPRGADTPNPHTHTHIPRTVEMPPFKWTPRQKPPPYTTSPKKPLAADV